MFHEWFLVNSDLMNLDLALKHRRGNFKSVEIDKNQTKGQILHFRGFFDVDTVSPNVCIFGVWHFFEICSFKLGQKGLYQPKAHSILI